MINIAICDDDVHFTGLVEKLLRKLASLKALVIDIDVFFDGDTLKDSIKRGTRYDLIYIDIEMKKVDGISAAHYIRKFDKTVILIYISGYDKYLIELFEVEPLRVLLKPLDHNKFKQYFDEAYNRISKNNAYYQYNFNKETRKVLLNDIIYFESDVRIIRIFLINNKCEYFYGKLNNVEKEIKKNKCYFLRIHQSFLVNYDYVKKMSASHLELDIGEGKTITLQISENKQKEIKGQLCKMKANIVN